jgi:hypothetical protein
MVNYNTLKALKKRNIRPEQYSKTVISVDQQVYSEYDTFRKEDLEDGILYELREIPTNHSDYGDCGAAIYKLYSRIETDQEFFSRLIKEYDLGKL